MMTACPPPRAVNGFAPMRCLTAAAFLLASFQASAQNYTSTIVSIFGANAPYDAALDTLVDGTFDSQKPPTWFTNPEATIESGKLTLGGGASMLNLTSPDTTLWSEVSLTPIPFEVGTSPDLAPESVAGFFFDTDGNFIVRDGDVWTTATQIDPAAIIQEHRIATYVDYAARTYSIWLDDVRVGDALAFARVGNGHPLQISFTGDGQVSTVFLELDEPAGLDNDGDGLDNSWELAQGLDPELSSGDNGATGNPDGDGFTNLEELQFNLTALEYEARVDAFNEALDTFETADGWSLGALTGQEQWLAILADVVQDPLIFTTQPDSGVQLDIAGGYADAIYANVDPVETNVQLTLDLAPMPYEEGAPAPAIENDTRLAFYLRPDGSLDVTDGELAGAIQWNNTGVVSEIFVSGWNRLEVHIDYTTEKWTVRAIDPDTSVSSPTYGPYTLLPATSASPVVNLKLSNDSAQGETYFDNVRVSSTAATIN